MFIKVYIFRTILPQNTIQTKKLFYHLQNEEDDTSASDDEESRPVLHLPLVASVKLDDDTGTGMRVSLLKFKCTYSTDYIYSSLLSVQYTYTRFLGRFAPILYIICKHGNSPCYRIT